MKTSWRYYVQFSTSHILNISSFVPFGSAFSHQEIVNRGEASKKNATRKPKARERPNENYNKTALLRALVMMERRKKSPRNECKRTSNQWPWQLCCCWSGFSLARAKSSLCADLRLNYALRALWYSLSHSLTHYVRGKSNFVRFTSKATWKLTS